MKVYTKVKDIGEEYTNSGKKINTMYVTATYHVLKEKNRYIDFLAIGGVLTGMVLFFASELKNPDALNQTKIFGTSFLSFCL